MTAAANNPGLMKTMINFSWNFGESNTPVARSLSLEDSNDALYFGSVFMAR